MCLMIISTYIFTLVFGGGKNYGCGGKIMAWLSCPRYWGSMQKTKPLIPMWDTIKYEASKSLSCEMLFKSKDWFSLTENCQIRDGQMPHVMDEIPFFVDHGWMMCGMSSKSLGRTFQTLAEPCACGFWKRAWEKACNRDRKARAIVSVRKRNRKWRLFSGSWEMALH